MSPQDPRPLQPRALPRQHRAPVPSDPHWLGQLDGGKCRTARARRRLPSAPSSRPTRLGRAGEARPRTLPREAASEDTWPHSPVALSVAPPHEMSSSSGPSMARGGQRSPQDLASRRWTPGSFAAPVRPSGQPGRLIKGPHADPAPATPAHTPRSGRPEWRWPNRISAAALSGLTLLEKFLGGQRPHYRSPPSRGLAHAHQGPTNTSLFAAGRDCQGPPWGAVLGGQFWASAWAPSAIPWEPRRGLSKAWRRRWGTPLPLRGAQGLGQLLGGALPSPGPQDL